MVGLEDKGLSRVSSVIQECFGPIVLLGFNSPRLRAKSQDCPINNHIVINYGVSWSQAHSQVRLNYNRILKQCHLTLVPTEKHVLSAVMLPPPPTFPFRCFVILMDWSIHCLLSSSAEGFCWQCSAARCCQVSLFLSFLSFPLIDSTDHALSLSFGLSHVVSLLAFFLCISLDTLHSLPAWLELLEPCPAALTPFRFVDMRACQCTVKPVDCLP